MRKVDFIIVGQGIAGTFLSWFLLKNKKTFIVIDEQKQASASKVAAGIIHPITGRRMVKAWMADTLIPFAQHTYQEMEAHFSRKIFHPFPIIELLSTAKEYNDWMSRSEDAGMQPYIENMKAENLYSEVLQHFSQKIIVKKTSWVNIGTFLSTFRDFILEEKMIEEEKFDHDQLVLENDEVRYKDMRAGKIIFCEGVEALHNPFWKMLPFLPAKGEILIVEAKMNLQHILNRKIYILPIGNNLFKVGSTYTWKFDDANPTIEAREFLISQLKLILKIPFEVVDQMAAVRPTVKNRRPFLGLHPEHNQIGIFNGLGTKGCLLAPFFADHLAGFLCGRNELMKEVDVGNSIKPE
ncbi:MAG: FAD-dependent oxidoreductase [Bacteroidota bacterium]